MRAKVFKSGNSQAVRLPKAFRFSTDEVVLRETGRGLERAFDLLCALPDGMLDARDDRPPQDREGL